MKNYAIFKEKEKNDFYKNDANANATFIKKYDQTKKNAIKLDRNTTMWTCKTQNWWAIKIIQKEYNNTIKPYRA